MLQFVYRNRWLANLGMRQLISSKNNNNLNPVLSDGVLGFPGTASAGF
ncbi:hypothetical protein CWATWH0402_3068 [Crocosphaera watsonii WH 0402]|uniref:Uncharacterized protein n=2 Tax=Crocosphaera watsonii TaxID=263511 RepID=T2JV60_CROWT|nr:hypothetical protein CWATWH0005_565 [Crocosphaera watsonii WH 0005]CCQ69110.1 hypothetical protein CWATWH0402_3068 [Crocosphaera watsonii WH 0402]